MLQVRLRWNKTDNHCKKKTIIIHIGVRNTEQFFLVQTEDFYWDYSFVGNRMALTVPSFHSSHQNRLLCQTTVCSESRLGDKELNITDTEPLHMLLEPPVLLSLIQTSSFQQAAEWSWFSSSVFGYAGTLRWKNYRRDIWWAELQSCSLLSTDVDDAGLLSCLLLTWLLSQMSSAESSKIEEAWCACMICLYIY